MRERELDRLAKSVRVEEGEEEEEGGVEMGQPDSIARTSHHTTPHRPTCNTHNTLLLGSSIDRPSVSRLSRMDRVAGGGGWAGCGVRARA